MGKQIAIVLVAAILAGCSTIPAMYSADGAMLTDLGKAVFSYTRTDTPPTQCRSDPIQKTIVCMDGTTSSLRLAGLPFRGVIFGEFDGRRFQTKEWLDEGVRARDSGNPAR